VVWFNPLTPLGITYGDQSPKEAYENYFNGALEFDGHHADEAVGEWVKEQLRSLRWLISLDNLFIKLGAYDSLFRSNLRGLEPTIGELCRGR
jgi:hypothetical protein